jgi:hypothetical protein
MSNKLEFWKSRARQAESELRHLGRLARQLVTHSCDRCGEDQRIKRLRTFWQDAGLSTLVSFDQLCNWSTLPSSGYSY